MSSYTPSKTLPEFLKKHKYIKGAHPCITHTRIPSKEHRVFGGAYYIDLNDIGTKEEFYDKLKEVKRNDKLFDNIRNDFLKRIPSEEGYYKEFEKVLNRCFKLL